MSTFSAPSSAMLRMSRQQPSGGVGGGYMTGIICRWRLPREQQALGFKQVPALDGWQGSGNGDERGALWTRRVDTSHSSALSVCSAP
jgi:hypothetical protein